MVRSAFRTKIETALLLAAAIFPSPVAAASQAEYPVAIPAQAPHFPERGPSYASRTMPTGSSSSTLTGCCGPSTAGFS